MAPLNAISAPPVAVLYLRYEIRKNKKYRPFWMKSYVITKPFWDEGYKQGEMD